jgi:dihydroflavonol-4-reductase
MARAQPKGIKVLVTGATGFLGGWVLRELLRHGHRPLALVRRSSRRDALDGLPVETVEGDVTDASSVHTAVHGAEAVLHLAGMISFRPGDRAQLYRVNVEGTRNVLEAACARGLRVVHASSVATIGFTDHPVVRDETSFMSEEDGIRYPYAGSKREGESVALALASQGKNVVVLNPGFLLGPGDNYVTSTRIVSQFLKGELQFHLAGGISMGDVRDVARAFVAALRQGHAGERYVLAGVNRSYGELLGLVAEIVGRRPSTALPTPLALHWAGLSHWAALLSPHRFDELNLTSVYYGSRYNYCDCQKALRELGYSSRDFEDTLRDTVADLTSRENGNDGGPRRNECNESNRNGRDRRRPASHSIKRP